MRLPYWIFTKFVRIFLVNFTNIYLGAILLIAVFYFILIIIREDCKGNLIWK